MKRTLNRIFAIAVSLCLGIMAISAQNSLPAPGSGGTYNPAPTNPGGPGNGPGWGGPGGPGWNGGPAGGITPVFSSPIWSNSGTENVIGCGYDAQGVWRTVPMTVSYSYNGVQYNVTVLNAWNPWMHSWSYGVNTPAFNTSYYLRGTWYNFYVVLSTGTYYFNL